MALIKCKMCGGNLTFSQESAVATCEYCATVQTVPSQDDEKKLVLFERANRLRYACEFDKAAGLYESIVADFRNEAEAYWGLVLCKYGIEYVDDPATGKKIPTCHRSSFDSVLEDDNYQQTLENADVVAAKVYREEAKSIERLRKGILEVSGKEDPYDIFICYKETAAEGGRTKDSVIAQDIYDALTSKGYRVFFSRITLEGKLGVDFEPYIFAALNSSRIMLAVGTDYDHYHAVWVKNEWSRFLQLMTKNKDKHLIPCYRDLDPEDLPVPFQRLQGQDMSKIGAMQDLLHGIEKLLPRKQEPVRETVTQRQDMATMLERGNMALEDGDWANAERFFEETLNRDPKNADAYFGKVLAQTHCPNADALVRQRLKAAENVTMTVRKANVRADLDAIVQKYKVPGYYEQDAILKPYQTFSRDYHAVAPNREDQKKQEELAWNTGILGRAVQFAAPGSPVLQAKEQIFSVMDQRVAKAQQQDQQEESQVYTAYADLEYTVQKNYNKACNLREQDYCAQKEVVESKKPTESALQKASELFTEMGDYKDSTALIAKAQEKIAVLKRKKARTTKITAITALSVVAIIVALAILISTVFIPASRYRKAEKLLEQGKRAQAAMLFYQLGDYKDAKDRSSALWDLTAQREAISAGNNHTVAVKRNGTVVATGDNTYGQCDVSPWRDIVAVSAGCYHTVALKSDGSVMSVGANGKTQCNVSHWQNIVVIDAGEFHTVGLQSDGTVVAAGDNSFGQRNVSDWAGIVSVSAGYRHTVGLKADGTVVAVGENWDGQCNVSDWTDIVSISAGQNHTVGLKSDGTVVAVGSSNSGQCDVSGWRDIVTISAGGFSTAGVKADGTVVIVGGNYYGECNVTDWKNIVSTSVGGYFTIGLMSDGATVAVGENWDGQCNVSGWTDIKLPG